MSNIGLKGSESANEWAKKRREQIESSKKMREERKSGNVLKNAGEHFVLKSPNRQPQANVTATSGFSQKSAAFGQPTPGAAGMQMASTSSSMGFNNYQKYHQESQQILNSQYTGAGAFGGLASIGMANKFNSNGFASQLDDNMIALKTQENYFIPQGRRENSAIGQSISYDRQEPQSITSVSGFKQNQQMNDQTQQRGAVLRKNSYSRQDLEAARSNLKILKNRMSSKTRERASSQIPLDEAANEELGNQRKAVNRGQSQFAHVPKPGRPPSGRPMQNPDNDTGYQNQNFRKAFVPNFGGEMQRQDSSEDVSQINDLVLNGGIALPRQQPQKRPQAVEYDPTNRSTKQPVRRLHQNQVLDQTSDMPSYSQQHQQPQQQQRQARRSQNEDQYEPMDDQPSQAKQSNYNDIYENVDDEGGAQRDVDRIECPTCGRKFVQEALQKHAKVCKKVFVQKRKVFDIKQQRQVEAENANDDYSYKPPQRQQQQKKTIQQDEKPIKQGSKGGKWKAQSEMFRAAMRAARGPDPKGGDEGGYGGGMQTTYEQHDDRTECKWCGRKFNDNAAQRHIPVCEKKYKENQIKSKGKPGMGVTRGTAMGFRK